MRKEILNAVAEEARRKEDFYWRAGEALDLKASIILLVVTFLGTLSGQLLSLSDLPVPLRVVQLVAVLAVCASGILTLCGLWPRTFATSGDPNEHLKYANELEKYYQGQPNAEDLVERDFEKARTDIVLSQIATNEPLATSKSRFNKLAFYPLAVAVLADLASLVWLAIWHVHL